MSRDYFYITKLDVRRDRSMQDLYDYNGFAGRTTTAYDDRCSVTIEAMVSTEVAQLLYGSMRDGNSLMVVSTGEPVSLPIRPNLPPQIIQYSPQPSTPVPVKVGQVWKSDVLSGEKTIKKLSFDQGEWRALYNECYTGQYISLDNNWLPITAGWSLIYDIPSEG